MVRSTALLAVFLTLAPATVHAFDHHHHHHHSTHHADGESGSGGGCSGDDDGDGAESSGNGGAGGSATASPPTPAAVTLRVFATSSVHTGDLGGLAGADAICQNAASAHGFEGVYRAWLSDGKTSAAERILSSGPWLTARGEVAFATRAELATVPRVAIVDEDGATAHGVWSGSDTRGRANGTDCEDWTSAKSFEHGTTGEDAQADATWGGGGLLDDCSAAHAILCIAQ